MVVVVLTLTHRYNSVRGHRTGSNISEADGYLGKETIKQNIIHKITETNGISQTRIKKRGDKRTDV